MSFLFSEIKRRDGTASGAGNEVNVSWAQLLVSNMRNGVADLTWIGQVAKAKAFSEQNPSSHHRCRA